MVADSLRPLSVGETLDQAFGLYRRHLGTLATIVLVVESVPLLLGIYVQSAGGIVATPTVGLLTIMLNYVLHSVATGAALFVISESYLGNSIRPAEALRRALPFIQRLLILSVLAGVAFAAATLAGGLVASAVGIMVGWLFGMMAEGAAVATFAGFVLAGGMAVAGLSVAAQALVLEEGRSPVQAMARSWSLTRRRRIQMLALVLVPMVLVAFPMVTLTVINLMTGDPLALGDGPPRLSPLSQVAVALASIAQVLLYPLIYSVLTVAYYDLRVRREGFDLDLLAAALRPAP